MLILCSLLALYICLESLAPLAAMGKGLAQFCHKVKYISALGVSVYFLYVGLTAAFAFVHLVSLSVIALFIWPRTVYRFHRWKEGLWIFNSH